MGDASGSSIGRPHNAERYPSGTTCYRHFRKWVELGVFDKIARSLVENLRKRGKIDATFLNAKKVPKGRMRLLMMPGGDCPGNVPLPQTFGWTHLRLSRTLVQVHERREIER